MEALAFFCLWLRKLEREGERERGVKEREGGEERKKKEEVLGMVLLRYDLVLI